MRALALSARLEGWDRCFCGPADHLIDFEKPSRPQDWKWSAILDETYSDECLEWNQLKKYKFSFSISPTPPSVVLDVQEPDDE